MHVSWIWRLAIGDWRMAKAVKKKGSKERDPARCRCGFDLEHPLVQPMLHFSPIKWVLLCFGATPYPTWVEYQCTRCETILKSTDDPKVMATF